MDKSQWQHLHFMRFILICLVVLWKLTALAQPRYQGIVLSAKDSVPIQNAFVILNSKHSVYTNALGEFSFDRGKLNADVNQLSIRAIGFASIEQFEITWSVQYPRFYLSEKEVVGNVLEVMEGPRMVFGSETWNVGDFDWDENGDMIILTYHDEDRWKRQEWAHTTLFRGGKLVRLKKPLMGSMHSNDNAQLYQQLDVPGTVLGFYDQFPGEIIVECMDAHYLLNQNEQNWELIELPDSVMKRHIKPVVDTLSKQNYIYSDYESSYPAFNYFIEFEGKAQVFHHIQDEKEMELFRSEYKYLGPREKVEAYQFELDHGIDKEIVAAYMRGFQLTHFHSPLYAPLVIKGDTILVFDHVHDQVHFFNAKGVPLFTKAIHYHEQQKMGKWLGKIWMDKTTRKIYTGYKKSGRLILMEIHPGRETFDVKQTLEHAYVEKIKIKGGDIFYIYKPFESTKKRYLYKEKIL